MRGRIGRAKRRRPLTRLGATRLATLDVYKRQAHVRVHQYPDGGLAVFHGPRAIARYTSEGVLIEAEPSKLAA